MPKQTCKTCMHARPICAGSNTMYCGHPSLSMLRFSLYSDDKVACEFYESKGCECIQERSCKDCEHFRSYDTKPGFGKCYHISVANTVSDKTAMICQWFSNDYNKTKSRGRTMTNADKIRQMTDEELIKYIGLACKRCVYHTARIIECADRDCMDGNLEWLQKEVSDDAGTD